MSEYDKCLASAKKTLAMREHSKFQLTNKLTNKGFGPDTINDVLEELIKSKFLSDERYTEEYIRYKQNSGYGSKKIIYELKSNGISAELISVNLHKFTDDFDILFEFAKYKTHDKNLDDQKILMKYMNNFKARGFDSSIILKVMENIKSHEK